MSKKSAAKAPTPETSEEGADMSRASSLSELSATPSVTPKVETMQICEVLAFCMPAGKQHSCTTNRLYLLADNGPLNDLHSYLSCLCTTCQSHVSKRRKDDELCKSFFKGEIYDGQTLVNAFGEFLCPKCKTHLLQTLHIRAGFKCRTIVNDLSVGEMARQVERDDILNAFHRNNDGSTLAEQNQFLDLIKRERSVTKALHNLTKEEIIKVFEEYTPGPGKLTHPMSYYDARKAILKHRKARVRRLGLMYAEKPKNRKKPPKPVPHAPRVGEVPGDLKLNREMRGLFGRQEDMRLNHGHLHEIASLKEQNTTGLQSNCRLLRNQNRETSAWKTNF